MARPSVRMVVNSIFPKAQREREIIAFAYDAVMRDVGKLRLLNKITGANGYPDGLTVDLDGHVCCAHWGGGVSWFSP